MTAPPTMLFKVRCISPVHVGSGKELVRDLDYFAQGNVTHILDSERLAEVTGGQGLAEWILDRKPIGQFLEARRLDPQRFSLHRIEGQIAAQRLRLAMRTGDGRPLVPGSSIKGALRTLLLAGFAGTDGPHSKPDRDDFRNSLAEAVGNPRVRREWKASAVENALFRSSAKHSAKPDPKTDVLRMLKLGDAIMPGGATTVVSSRAVGTTRSTLTASEAIKAGTACGLRVQTADPFLEQKFFTGALPSVEVLAAWSRTHAEYLLEGDEDYFAKHDLPGLARRCGEILDKVRAAPPLAIFLRIGWGTGWRTMTGDLLDPEQRGRVIERVGKTRRVIIEGHSARGDPRDFFGWVVLEPVEQEEARELFAAAAPPAMVEPPHAAAVAAEERPAPAPTAGDLIAGKIAAFQDKDFGRLQSLCDEIGKIPDLREQQRCAQLVLRRLSELFPRDKRKLTSARAMLSRAGVKTVEQG